MSRSGYMVYIPEKKWTIDGRMSSGMSRTSVEPGFSRHRQYGNSPNRSNYVNWHRTDTITEVPTDARSLMVWIILSAPRVCNAVFPSKTRSRWIVMMFILLFPVMYMQVPWFGKHFLSSPLLYNGHDQFLRYTAIDIRALAPPEWKFAASMARAENSVTQFVCSWRSWSSLSEPLQLCYPSPLVCSAILLERYHHQQFKVRHYQKQACQLNR